MLNSKHFLPVKSNWRPHSCLYCGLGEVAGKKCWSLLSVFNVFFYIVYYFSSDEEPAGTGRGETKRAGPWWGLEVIPWQANPKYSRCCYISEISVPFFQQTLSREMLEKVQNGVESISRDGGSLHRWHDVLFYYFLFYFFIYCFVESFTRDKGGLHRWPWCIMVGVLLFVMVVIMIRILTIVAPMMHNGGNTCGDDGLLQITKPHPRVFLANNTIG